MRKLFSALYDKKMKQITPGKISLFLAILVLVLYSISALLDFSGNEKFLKLMSGDPDIHFSVPSPGKNFHFIKPKN